MKSRPISFVLRVPIPLHKWLKITARERNLSLNSLCCQLLDDVRMGRDKTHSELTGVVEALRDWLGPNLLGIVLFGSRARGDSWQDSDYDLLIVLSSDFEITRELYRSWDVLAIGSEISPHFIHLPSNSDRAPTLFLEAALDGHVLYDGEGLTTSYLGTLRDTIATGRHKKHYLHGQPVWRSDEEPKLSS